MRLITRDYGTLVRPIRGLMGSSVPLLQQHSALNITLASYPQIIMGLDVIVEVAL